MNPQILEALCVQDRIQTGNPQTPSTVTSSLNANLGRKRNKGGTAATEGKGPGMAEGSSLRGRRGVGWNLHLPSPVSKARCQCLWLHVSCVPWVTSIYRLSAMACPRTSLAVLFRGTMGRKNACVPNIGRFFHVISVFISFECMDAELMDTAV